MKIEGARTTLPPLGSTGAAVAIGAAAAVLVFAARSGRRFLEP